MHLPMFLNCSIHTFKSLLDGNGAAVEQLTYTLEGNEYSSVHMKLF